MQKGKSTFAELAAQNFRKWDKDNNGFLEGKELWHLAEQTFIDWANEKNWYGSQVHSEKEINDKFQQYLPQILSEFDRNKDGKVSFEEYTAVMKLKSDELEELTLDAAINFFGDARGSKRAE